VLLADFAEVRGLSESCSRSPAMGKKEEQRDPVLNFKSRVPVSLRNAGSSMLPRLGPTKAQAAFSFPDGLGYLFRKEGKPIGIPNHSHRHPREIPGAGRRAASKEAMAAWQREGRVSRPGKTVAVPTKRGGSGHFSDERRGGLELRRGGAMEEGVQVSRGTEGRAFQFCTRGRGTFRGRGGRGRGRGDGGQGRLLPAGDRS
jgi:hypothetical protein